MTSLMSLVSWRNRFLVWRKLTIYVKRMYYARTFKMNYVIAIYICTCIVLRGVLTSLFQESQGLTTYAFVMLLLVMISLHMLTFRLMVTMVAEFCSLVILIHNTLQREITISSTWTTGNIIPLFPSTYWYISTFKDSISLILSHSTVVLCI